MTNGELLKNWREYAILFDKDAFKTQTGVPYVAFKKPVPLAKLFVTCYKNRNGGLYFEEVDEGGERAAVSFILKTNRRNVCYLYISDQDFSGGGRWERIGVFVKLNSTPQ